MSGQRSLATSGTIDEPLELEAPRSESTNTGTLAKYRKMAKLGIPGPAVVLKMKADCCAAEAIAQFEVRSQIPG